MSKNQTHSNYKNQAGKYTLENQWELRDKQTDQVVIG